MESTATEDTAGLLPEPPAGDAHQLLHQHPSHWRRLVPPGIFSSAIHGFLLSLAVMLTVVELPDSPIPIDTRDLGGDGIVEKHFPVEMTERQQAVEETKKVEINGFRLGPEKKGMPADPVRLLIADLDSDAFNVRSAATERLLKLGPDVIPELRQALVAGKPSLEAQRRLEAILEKLQTEPIVQPPESLAGENPKLDVPFVPTPQAVVDEMLKMAKVQPGEVVMDLGSGDGRIPITAAKDFAAWGFGYDLDPQWIKESRENARLAGVQARVVFEQRDMFKLDLRRADVVTLDLSRADTLGAFRGLLQRKEHLQRLLPQVAKMAPGSRVVFQGFPIDGYVATRKVVAVNSGNFIEYFPITLYTLPLQKDTLPLQKAGDAPPPPQPAIPVQADGGTTGNDVPAGPVKPLVQPADSAATGERRVDVVFVPTPQDVVDEMLKLAKVKPGEIVIDPGCGDGRIPITAAKLGAWGFGYDIDPNRIKESLENAQKQGMQGRTLFEQRDAFKLDLSRADVVAGAFISEQRNRQPVRLENIRVGAMVEICVNVASNKAVSIHLLGSAVPVP